MAAEFTAKNAVHYQIRTFIIKFENQMFSLFVRVSFDSHLLPDCGVAMDFTRVLRFLTERNLENLHDVFKLQKIDDNVAPNLTLKQLASLGLVMGDAIAFTKEFGK